MDPGAVRVIGNTGKEGKGENQFAQPRGICVDSRTKEVFIVDCNNHRIQVYHLNSLAYIRQIGKGVQGDSPGALNYAVGICLDDNNQIYVADTNNHRVVVFNRITGGHVRNISSQGTVPGCLYSPYGVCVDLYTNILYVADYDNHRIQTFNKETGEHIRVIGSGFGSGDGQMNQPIVVCIDYEMDTLLVADYSNNRVIVFDKETYAFICNIGNNEGANSLCGPRGLCLNKEANLLFVADRENHRVQVYDKSTYQYIRTIGEGPGTNPGQFHRPMELCVNVEEGVLLVVDGYNHRVQILELPELLPEKRRLRALAKSRAEAEVRGRTIPKPSLLAVSTPITGRDLLVWDSAGHWRLRFERLGPLFDVSLSASDLSALLSRIGIASFMSEDALSPLERDCVEAGSTAVSPCHTSSSSSDLALRRQGGMFISILESLCSTNQEADANLEDTTSPPYMLAAPALFALHSLIDRGWTPTTMPECVVALLTTFLSNIRCGIAKEEDTNKLQSAIIVLLRAAVVVSEPIRESVLHAVLAVLDKKPASTEALHTASTTAADVDSADILLSQMNLLAAILSPSQSTAPAGLLSRKKTPSKTVSRTTSRASFSSPTGFHPTTLPYIAHTTSVHERRKQCNQLRDDALEFLYGVTFMNSVNRDTAKGQSSEPRRTLKITLPVEGALPELAMSSTAANTGTTTQVVNNIDMTSHDFAPSLATATSTVPSNANTLPSGFSDLIRITYKIQKIRTKEKKCTLSDYAHSAASSSALAHCNESPLQTDDGESLQSLQVKLFRSASNYFIELRQEEARIYRSAGGRGMQSSAHCHMRRTRGGRNIWRPSEPLAPGDLVDAQDKERCWFESIVQEITADGNVKVHFMGWGSKWDDIITPTELTARLAPLNTKTKNWRADLFSGGLIEIKCNDDPVNQKWMWGKITALNTEEAWVEVSYLFSNEPSVVKRAWLFGETICPVGMHTKDKSKAAAALLVKPLKKVEDIIRERSEVLIPDDEYMFFDSSDDLDETALDAELAYSTADSQEHPTQEQQLHSPHSAASSLLFPALVESPAVCELLELCRSNTNDALQSVHIVGLSVLECLIGELVQGLCSSVATAVTSTSSSSETELDECQQLAGHLITHWARGPYRRLLVPYLTRPLTFQCGVRSRLLASRVLQRHHCSTPPPTVTTTSGTTATTSSIADHWQDCTSILQLFQTFSEHSSAYCSILHRTCTTALPTTSITAVTSRINATIYRCGTMEIMNNLISCMIQNTTLRSQLFYIFDTKNRFKTENIQLRKCLSYLFKNASKIEIIKVQNLIEGILIKTELSNMDFKPHCNKKGIIKITWAIRIILKIIKLLRNIKSIVSVEFMNIPNLKFAGERALRREFAELNSESIRVFAQCCAMVLDVSLCEREVGGQEGECVGSGGCTWQQGLDGVCEGWQQRQHGECEEGLEGVCMSPSQKEDCLSSTLNLVKLLMTEELLHYFQPAYESLLAARLLSQRYRTLQEERAVLDTLPVMPSAARMLQEASLSSTVNLDFSLYLMEKVDNEEVQYCPALEIVLEQRAVTVQVLCQHTWYKHCGREMYYNLMLPAPLRTIQAQFECFYQQKAQDNSSSGLGARRLTWCRSVGVVTMQFTSRPGVSFELRVSEPQAAVLYLFNTNSTKSRTVADIAIGTNLSLEELRPVLESLCGGDEKRLLPLLQIQDRDRQGSVYMGSKVRLSEELRSPDLGDFVDHPPSTAVAGIVWDYSRIFPKKLQLADRNSIHDWRRELIDAAVVRVLKATAATAGTASMQQALKCGPSRIDRENKPNEILSAQELSEKVQAELKQRGCLRNSSCSNKEVLQRADHLAALGYIDKVALSPPPSSAAGGREQALHNPAVSLVSIDYVYISAVSNALSTNPSVRVQLREEVDGTELFHTLQSILDQQHVCPALSLHIDRQGASMGAAEDHSSGIGKTNADFGETKSEASADEGSTPEKVQDTPIQQPGSRAFPGHSAKDTIAMLTLQRGIVSWVAQQQPSLRPLNLPANRSSSEHSDPATTTTPPRPSLRPRERLSGSFPIVCLNPSSSHMDTAPDGGPVLKMSAARTESKSALDSPMAATFPQFPRHSPVVSAHTVSPHSAGICAVPFPLFPNNSASPCQETRADHVLAVLNARLYGVLGAIVSQLSKLVFQHSVGSAPAVLRPDLLAFGPPSIQSYLSEIHSAYALSASSRRTQDWSLLHKYMFFKLPVEMITALCLRFSSTLEADSLPTVAHDAEFWEANWNTMFALRSASETSTANKADESAESFSNEDSKESTAAFDNTAQASQSFLSARSPVHNSNTERRSLVEFVSEALNRDQYCTEHSRFAGLNRSLAAGDDLLPEELFPLFAASTARSRSGEASPSQNHYQHSASGSGGSGKRRMRGRSSRAHSVRGGLRGSCTEASSALHSTTAGMSKLRRSSSSEEGTKTNDAIRGISFAVDGDARTEDFNWLLMMHRDSERSLSDQYLGDPDGTAGLQPTFSFAGEASGSSVPSSRSSSRSNSHADFGVAQLMLSIEEQLRQTPLQSPAPSALAGYAKGTPPRSAAQSSASKSAAHPTLSAEFVYKPESNSQYMTPRSSSKVGGRVLSDSSSIMVDNSVSGSSEKGRTSATSSLFQLLQQYFQSFFAIFTRLMGSSMTACPVPTLDTLQLTELAIMLLQAASEKIVPKEELGRKAHCPARRLWILTGASCALKDVFVSAFAELDSNKDGLLSVEDFGSAGSGSNAILPPRHPHISSTGCLEWSGLRLDTEVRGHYVNNAAFMALSETRRRSGDLLELVEGVARVLSLPLHRIARLLSEHGWDASTVLNYFCEGGKHTVSDCYGQSFICLRDSRVDQIARGVSSCHSVCDTCHCARSVESMYALRCRHFNCSECWERSVLCAVQSDCGTVCCAQCRTEPAYQHRQSGEGVAGDDLVLHIASKQAQEQYFQGVWRRMTQLYEDQNSTAVGSDELLQLLLQSPRNRSAPLMSVSVDKAHSYGNTSQSVFSIQNRPPSLFLSGDTQLFVDHSSRHSQEHVNAASVRVTTPAARLSALSARLASASSGRIPRSPPPPSSAHPVRAAASTDIGVGVDTSTASSWASDRTEGNLTKYLLETRTLILAKATEAERVLRCTCSESQLQLYSDKLAVLDQYLRAVELVKHFEDHFAQHSVSIRTGKEREAHEICEAVMGLLDLLIVTSVKVRTKWSTADGFTSQTAREFSHYLRQRMHGIVAMLRSPVLTSAVAGQKHREGRFFSLVAPSSVGHSMCMPYRDSGREKVDRELFGILTESLTPHTPDSKNANTSWVSSKLSGASIAGLAECRQLVERLHSSLAGGGQRTGLQLMQEVVAFADSGLQSALFARNICPILLSHWCKYSDDASLSQATCIALEKMCFQSAPCAQALIALDIWNCIAATITTWHANADICIACAGLTTAILTSSEENKKASLGKIEQTALFTAMRAVLLVHEADFKVSQAVISAVVHCLDKGYTADSSFMRADLSEVLVQQILHFATFPGMKTQFVVAISRLASGNRYMQEALVDLNVLEYLMEIIADCDECEPGLLKLTCFAVGTLVARYHAAQTKFATQGGCRAICYALRTTQDLGTLTYILRAIAALSQQNAYVQDFFELESAVELMQTKKDELLSLAERTESFETKSKLNLLLLTCEYALDAVRVPAARRNGISSSTGTVTAAGAAAVGNANFIELADSFRSSLADYARLVMASTNGRHRPQQQQQRSTEASSAAAAGLAERTGANTPPSPQQAPAAASSRYDRHSSSNRGPL